MESLASTCMLVGHQPQWEALLIYPLKSIAAEIPAAKGKAECTHPESAVCPLEEASAEVSGTD